MGIVAGLASSPPASPAGATPVPAAAVSQKHPDRGSVACDGQVYVSFGNPEDQLYTADRGPGTVQDDGAVTRIDIAHQSVDFFAGVLPGGEDFGGVFTYGNGDLGFFRNSGQLFRVHVKDATGSNPQFTVLSTQTTTPATNLDATSCFLDSSADLAVYKRGPKSVEAGGEITYRITVKNVGKNGSPRNAGNGDSSGWSLTDDLPAEILSPTTPTEGCEITDGLLSCTGGPLAKGHGVEIEVTGTAADVSGPTTVKNTATVFGDDADPRKHNNKDTTSTQINP